MESAPSTCFLRRELVGAGLKCASTLRLGNASTRPLVEYDSVTTGCGSSGWQAPELLLHGRQTRAVDLFSLGCVLFFCITGGRHPFGSRLEREINIAKNKVDLSLLEHIPEVVDLLLQLLNPNAEMRLYAYIVGY